ncbi:MAG TPA: ABC transporter permease [Phycisphaerae bacterium]|nr:ABC transporter permease [Phycisphaerae bacterium]
MAAARSQLIKGAATVLLLDALATTGLYAYAYWRAEPPPVLRVTIWALHGALLFSFLLLARRDIWFLFIRPATSMGIGLSRVWAVARTTIFEAWAGRIWLLPLLWLACALLLICAIVPFDESERIPLYIRALLTSQQVLLLVMMWVMACVSLPRERERKTLVSTSSKPLSRLEILLGKFTGFAVASGLVMLFMYGSSMIILHVSDLRLRGRAAEAFQIQSRDFNKTLVTPSQELEQLSREGSLYAYNYITVPPEGMSILGGFQLVDPLTGKPKREILGGTNEKISYRFTPYLPALPDALVAPKGLRPYFEFYFPLAGNTKQPIRINISAYCSQSHRIPPPHPQEKTILLNADGVGRWEPDEPLELFTPVHPQTLQPIDPATFEPTTATNGEVTLDITCTTPDVFLQVFDGAELGPSGTFPPGTNFNVVLRADRRIAESVIPPRANPIIRGFERRDRQEIAGPKLSTNNIEYALYHFPGSTLRNVPVDRDGNFTITVQAETYKSGNSDEATHANIDFMSTDPTSGDMYTISPPPEILEKRPMQFSIPKRMLGDTDPSKRGDLYVRVCCVTPEHSISLVENSVRIELPRTPFFVNYFKSELIIYFQVLLLIAIGITASVRVGWPVAMFLSAICVAFGTMVDFIASLREYGGLGALNYRAMSNNPDGLFKFFDTAASNLWEVLGFISSIVPNFNLYDPNAYIGSLQNTPWIVVWNGAFAAATYLLAFLALAYLMFRKQELG